MIVFPLACPAGFNAATAASRVATVPISVREVVRHASDVRFPSPSPADGVHLRVRAGTDSQIASIEPGPARCLGESETRDRAVFHDPAQQIGCLVVRRPEGNELTVAEDPPVSLTRPAMVCVGGVSVRREDLGCAVAEDESPGGQCNGHVVSLDKLVVADPQVMK